MVKNGDDMLGFGITSLLSLTKNGWLIVENGDDMSSFGVTGLLSLTQEATSEGGRDAMCPDCRVPVC